MIDAIAHPSDVASPHRLVVLGTGGTIAGSGGAQGANIGYTAATITVSDLIAGVEPPLGMALVAEQVAQLDSKDMDLPTWLALRARCVHWLSQPDVAGVVITHGTDTIEETAFFLACTLETGKPVVLTCAMRPASAQSPDGPQNLRDALAVAAQPGAAGVTVVCAGEVHGARHVSKVHPYRLNAFGSGDAGALGYVEEGRVRLLRPWPAQAPVHGIRFTAEDGAAGWPRVAIAMSHAGVDGTLVDLLTAQRTAGQPGAVDGIVLAATGNGSLHRALEQAAERAQQAGIAVLIASRTGSGCVLRPAGQAIPDAGDLSPTKARILLMLQLRAQARVL